MTEIVNIPNEAQLNELGHIAVKYRQEGRVFIDGSETPSRFGYVFVTEAHICLAWIRPIDLQFVLNKKEYCCGDRPKDAFFLANESDVRRWTNRGGE